MAIIPVVLSGGSGTRLWPVSRALYPKQLIPLLGERSLLQQTMVRASHVAPNAVPIVVCNQEHRFTVAEQLQQVGIQQSRILLEPFGRNTAPAIALAALEALVHEPEATLLVLPSDHLLKDVDAFSESVYAAEAEAEAGALVTFGIKPDGPATGYGYIAADRQHGIAQVQQFVEKPNAELAEQYVSSGHYYWNSGMFLFKAQAYLDALAEFAPGIHSASAAAYQEVDRDLDFLRIPGPEFKDCPSDSIDYAVMEKASNVKVVPLQAGWSDLGSWQSLWQAEEKDQSGNVTAGDVLLHDAEGCYVRSEYGLVGVLGVKDHIVIETADAVLVAHKDRAEDIKFLVDKMKASGREEVNLHKLVYRPWGSYESIDEASRFKVKRITVKPGASLSLQMHHHRAEHWIVVQGAALVTCDDKQYKVNENESTYIPVGSKHRLENPGKIPLELIEVQSGGYLGEDDIVRFEDKYGR